MKKIVMVIQDQTPVRDTATGKWVPTLRYKVIKTRNYLGVALEEFLYKEKLQELINDGIEVIVVPEKKEYECSLSEQL